MQQKRLCALLYQGNVGFVRDQLSDEHPLVVANSSAVAMQLSYSIARATASMHLAHASKLCV